ncbi:NAD(P)/FAD-dependent oxidoreductase [Marinoscillum sp. MHG1-6]|uniref:NAD(P)/FAD-dependent oxidoreductase n=1 Tax=Marinoscillum sp. MHG1-6 TaxID=2959627 RepID=UPI0021574415|nr:NAD(P)/FAD-dependent oxidoreductase [Marinoscillum sp. MHG1-6]
MSQQVIIIGGGAAGYFSAINIAEKHPDYKITILEKAGKGLAKVKVSGGGRCNVTNQRDNPSELTKFYPRGQKQLHLVFKAFTTSDMVRWLSQRGVDTVAEADQRVFPVSNSSQTIIDCFVNRSYELGIKTHYHTAVKAISTDSGEWIIETNQGKYEADKVIFATGSTPSSLNILSDLGLEITPLAPSLFTFNIDDPRLHNLPGVSFENVHIKVVKSKLEESGPLLITHWGLSGPVVLKLSAWGALELKERKYDFGVLINFVPGLNQEEVRSTLQELKTTSPKKKTMGAVQFGLPKRFWERMCATAGILDEQQNLDLSKKQINKLIEELTQGLYPVKGKSTFKEEFVTCGGVSLKEVSLKTFECKRFPGLYLAGEVLDIDGITGGFNFQACWSAGWVISENI